MNFGLFKEKTAEKNLKNMLGDIYIPLGLKGLKYIYFHVRDTRVFGLIRIFLINFIVDNWHLITARIANCSLENGFFLGLLSDCSFLCLSVCLFVQHNTLTPIELQSWKFKYSFLTRVPRKVFERFSKFCFFWSLKFF